MIVSGLAGGALLVAEDGFGRARRGHAASASRCEGAGGKSHGRGLAEEMAGSNAHSIRECRVGEKPERVWWEQLWSLRGGAAMAALLINCELSQSYDASSRG
jgi:hypothetical protein